MNGYETWEMVEQRRQDLMRHVEQRRLIRLARQSPCPERPRRLTLLVRSVRQALSSRQEARDQEMGPVVALATEHSNC